MKKNFFRFLLLVPFYDQHALAQQQEVRISQFMLMQDQLDRLKKVKEPEVCATPGNAFFFSDGLTIPCHSLLRNYGLGNSYIPQIGVGFSLLVALSILSKDDFRFELTQSLTLDEDRARWIAEFADMWHGIYQLDHFYNQENPPKKLYLKDYIYLWESSSKKIEARIKGLFGLDESIIFPNNWELLARAAYPKFAKDLDLSKDEFLANFENSIKEFVTFLLGEFNQECTLLKANAYYRGKIRIIYRKHFPVYYTPNFNRSIKLYRLGEYNSYLQNLPKFQDYLEHRLDIQDKVINKKISRILIRYFFNSIYEYLRLKADQVRSRL